MPAPATEAATPQAMMIDNTRPMENRGNSPGLASGETCGGLYG